LCPPPALHPFPTRRSSDLQFLADVSFKCPDCHGRRFRDEVLEVQCRGLSIADVLERSAVDVVAVFRDVEPLVRALQPMIDVGLGDRKSTRLNSSHVSISYA